MSSGPLLLTLVLLAFSPARATSWEPAVEKDIALYEQGRLALEGRQPREAEGYFRTLVQRSPGCGLCAQGLGYALLLQNRSIEARQIFAGLVSAFPDQPQARVALSEASFAMQDFKTARSAAEAALKLHPESLEAQMALQAALLRTGDLAAAGRALDEAQLHLGGPEIACLEAQLSLEARDVAGARELVIECRRSAREDLVTTVEGLLAQASGRTDEASALMGALGADAASQVMWAADLYNSGRTAEAAQVLDAVLARNPDRLDARIIRGQARASLKDLKGAREDLEIAFRGESWVEVHSSGMMSGILRRSDEEKLQKLVMEGAAILVRILADDGDTGRARAVLGQAQKLGRNSALIASEAWLQAAEGQVNAAWKTLATALVQGDQDPILRETAGRLAHRSLSTAPPVVLAAIRAQGPAHARYNLASALANAGRHADCLAEVVAAPNAELAALDAPARAAFDVLGYRCAVDAEDLASADARLARLGEIPLEGSAFAPAFNHALLLERAGQPDRALAIVARMSASDRRARQKLISLGLALEVELGRTDAALARAADPDTAGEDLAWLASVLASQDRGRDARPLLARACPQLTGPEAGQCLDLAAALEDTGG